MTTNKIWLVASLLGAAGITAGAFGAHMLEQRLSESALATFETAVRYQMYHALALLWLGSAAKSEGIVRMRLTAWCWIAGILLFSGSLYAVSLFGIRSFGMVAPIGGTLLIAGWIVLAFRLYESQVE